MKILNLYACLGGNRYLWGDDHEITAVEWDEELARLYSERFPNDKVIVADAHQYLLDHYKEYDFIWSSPPCPTHSRARYWGIGKNGKKPIYPDMKLYQEVIFLQTHYSGKYVVENVIPYYTPLIPAKKRGRHLYWTNFNLPTDLKDRRFPISKAKSELKWYRDAFKGEMARHDQTKASLRSHKAAKTRIKNRISKGICPCCNWYFENLAKHMTTEHPHYTKDSSDDS